MATFEHSFDDNYIRFSENCEKTYAKIKDDTSKKMDIQFGVYSDSDPAIVRNLEIYTEDLLIPGSQVGASDDYCYIAVFKQGI